MPQAIPYLAYAATGSQLVAFAAMVAVADYQSTQAKEKARQAAREAARNRTFNIRSGVAPRKVVLGTVRLGGAVMYADLVGDEQQFVDQVIAINHGRISNVLGVYLGDTFIPAADIVDGVPTTGKYSGASALESGITHVATLTASDTITLPYLPAAGYPVHAIKNNSGTAVGADADHIALTVASVVGSTVTLSEPVTGEVWVTYSTAADVDVPVRLQWTQGLSTPEPTSWAGVDTPKWTITEHLLQGVSYLRTLMLTDAAVFATGLAEPNLVVQGPYGVYDPRTETTLTYTSNPALLAAWYAMLPRIEGGFGIPTDWIDWPSVAAAANVCDELITVRKMDGTGYESIKRYECHTVLQLADTTPEDNMDIIKSSMAGDFVFTAGRYHVFAGAFRPATVTITDDDLDGESTLAVAPLNSPEVRPPNTMSARIYSSTKNWLETGAVTVRNTTYITADGEEVADELELPATTDERQANYLMGVALEQQRPRHGLQLTLLGKGADVALCQTVQLALTGYDSLVGKTFEVRRRENDWTGRYGLELREVRASTWTLDPDRFTAPDDGDLTPDSSLWNVDPPVITDVVNAALALVDGSLLARALVVWAAHGQNLVNPHGHIEVRYRAPAEQWTYAPPVRGNTTGTFIGPLSVGTALFIQARARNALGAVSSWAQAEPFQVTGTNDLPPDPTGYGWEIKPAQAVVYWDPVSDSSLEMELRLGPTSWASASLMWRGRSTDYKVARPPNGTYRVWMAWRRQIGPGDDAYSAAPVYVDVVIDDSIDGGTGGALVVTADGTHFVFADGTTHASVSPPINFIARGIGLFGTATWSARAFDAFSGGTDIGAVSLTVNGNGATLTAAQFVAPGSSGSVRRVEVTGLLGGQSDTRSVYRLDPTVTAPVLWLSDERVVVPGDAAGEHPDLTNALTYAAVYQGTGTGIAELTNVHTWSILADAGITAIINGVAGPVVNPASVLVQVTAMTIRSGVVTLTATPASGPALTATWYIDISAADGSGWNAYWQPPSLTLAVRPDGSVATFDGAESEFVIASAANQLDDTANWGKSITARNVTAELVGARVQITGWLPLGQVSAGAVIPATLHASWTRADWPIYTPRGNWLQPGYNNSAPWATVRRATAYDAAPWTDIAVPSGWWAIGDASRDTIILGEVTGSSNRYIRSVDDGLTWIEETLPSGAQRTSWIHTGAEWLVSSHDSTAGYRSVTGVAGTWSAVTMPGLGCQLAGGAGVVLATTSMGVQFYSVNGGVNWLPMADGYSGAAAFKGRLYTLLAGDTTKMLVWDGGRWVKQALPASAAGFSGLLVIRDVLYLIAGGNIMYTSDGLTWRAGGSGTSTLGAWVRSGSRALMVDFIPHTNTEHSASNWAVWKPLLSTSDTEASVTMRATKPGEEDVYRTLMVYKGQAPRVTYVASADPADCPVPATSDGRVTSFANAVITANVKADGVDVTSLYTITWQTTYLTPASGSGAVATITGMSDTEPLGYIDWQAVRPGYDVVTGRTIVRKIFGDTPGGPLLRRAFIAIGQATTSISLRFGSDGWWYTKVGPSGSWIAQDRWVLGADPAGFWLYMYPPPEGGFTSGTTGSWLQMNANRDFTYSNASPGVYTRSVVLGFNASASDAGAGWGGGSLRLEVP